MILEVIGIERLDNDRGHCYKLTLEGKSETIYNNQAYLKLTPEAAKGVSIGDEWLVQPVTLTPAAEIGDLRPVRDVVSEVEKRAGIDMVPEVPLGWMPDTEEGKG